MGSPKYLQIHNDILHDIRTGLLKPGDKLPTRGELMEKYGAAHTTIESAIARLRQENVVSAIRKLGTFVSVPSAHKNLAIVSRFSPPDAMRVHESPSTFRSMMASLVSYGDAFTLRFIDESSIREESSDGLAKYDAAIVVEPSDTVLERIARSSARIIITNRYSESFEFISTHHRRSMHDMAAQQIGQSDPDARIFYLDMLPTSFPLRERLCGFVDACEASQRFYRTLVLQSNFEEDLRTLMGISPDAGRQIVLVSPSLQCTGVVMRFALERGLQLGKDLLYSDFDNSHSEALFGVRIPTVLQDYASMGAAIAKSVPLSDNRPIATFIPHTIIR